MPDIELRKELCQELDWSLIEDENGYFYIHHGGKRVQNTGHFNSPDSDWHDFLPALESDPGVSEPAFSEWCDKNGLLWDLYKNVNGKYSCAIYRPNLNGVLAHITNGATPSDARAKAWLKALEQLRSER